MSSFDSTLTMVRPPGRLRSFYETIAPALHAAFRIGVALLFMQHGAQKLFGWFGGMDGQGGTAALDSLMGVAGVLEFFGGLLILIGLLTRPIALLLAGEMAVAYVMAHLPQGGAPIENQGELALLFALSFLLLFGYGAGPLSVDRAIAGRGTRAEVEPTHRRHEPTRPPSSRIARPERRRDSGV